MYSFDASPIKIDGSLYYPFEVKYHIQGVAKEKDWTMFFHAVTHKKDILKTMAVTFNNKPGSLKLKSYDGELLEVQLLRDKQYEYKKGDSIDIILTCGFSNTSGISNKGTQRLLFYPLNFSSKYASEAKVKINISLMYGALPSFRTCFCVPSLFRISDDISDNITYGYSSFSEHSSLGSKAYETIIKINDRTLKTLYAIEFSPKEFV
jgi:hypothetical protein